MLYRNGEHISKFLEKQLGKDVIPSAEYRVDSG
jgi:hypothetical protein